MKRVGIILLTATMTLALFLTGCASNEEKVANKAKQSDGETTTSQEKTAKQFLEALKKDNLEQAESLCSDPTVDKPIKIYLAQLSPEWQYSILENHYSVVYSNLSANTQGNIEKFYKTAKKMLLPTYQLSDGEKYSIGEDTGYYRIKVKVKDSCNFEDLVAVYSDLNEAEDEAILKGGSAQSMDVALSQVYEGAVKKLRKLSKSDNDWELDLLEGAPEKWTVIDFEPENDASEKGTDSVSDAYKAYGAYIGSHFLVSGFDVGQYSNGAGQLIASMENIDGDDIPEMVIGDSAANHAAETVILKYNKGKVFCEGPIGSNGLFSYYEKTGLVMNENEGMGEKTVSYFLINPYGPFLIPLGEKKSEYPDGNYESEPASSEYYFLGKQSNETECGQCISSFIGKTNPKKWDSYDNQNGYQVLCDEFVNNLKNGNADPVEVSSTSNLGSETSQATSGQDISTIFTEKGKSILEDAFSKKAESYGGGKITGYLMDGNISGGLGTMFIDYYASYVLDNKNGEAYFQVVFKNPSTDGSYDSVDVVLSEDDQAPVGLDYEL